ncbi:LPXTG cell wall anchor domain-containing protein [Streptomyces sp. NPDC049627]|uniref:LPXTG cell wall anchor domain-containing protein n=1 Tax=Streptomyces sp. NPDC049627 TaxID=3365595 RepID=UPI0037B28C09
MRLHTPASLCLAAAAALLAAAPPAHAESPAELPGCATDDREFPLTTRLRGGPDSYTAGGGFGTWYLDLTNSTGRTCTGIHPVVVLVDGKRALKPSQPRLEFYGTPVATPNGTPTATPNGPPDPTRPRPVRFETTDEDELVGAFDGFPGFTVGPRATLTVKVRLALTSDAVPNEVTANAAVVQRHDGDGDWVGQSNDYRFTVDADADVDADTAAPTHPADQAASARPSGPSASPTPGAPRNQLTLADELARTGFVSSPHAAFAATAVLLLGGAGLLFARRRR